MWAAARAPRATSSKRRLSKSGKFCRFVPDPRVGTDADSAIRPLRPGDAAFHADRCALWNVLLAPVDVTAAVQRHGPGSANANAAAAKGGVEVSRETHDDLLQEIAVRARAEA